jgi:hypothetical protein
VAYQDGVLKERTHDCVRSFKEYAYFQRARAFPQGEGPKSLNEDEGKRRGGRWLAALAGLAGLTAGALGAALIVRRKRGALQQGKSIYPEYNRRGADRWARPGMGVTFRAELMPGRSRSERTHRITEILPSGRVMLENFSGDHAESEFEPVKLEG